MGQLVSFQIKISLNIETNVHNNLYALQESWIAFFQGQVGSLSLFRKSLTMEQAVVAPQPILTSNQVEDIVHDTIEPKQR